MKIGSKRSYGIAASILILLSLAMVSGACKSPEKAAVTSETEIPAAITDTSAITPDEARGIAKEAYIYAFPMIENYKTIYAYYINKSDPEYKGPFNEIINTARVYTPEDTIIVTPNSDTPYSFALLDLRAEPVVLTVPAVEKDRYYSVQLVDLYTYNFDYIGSRATGNGAGSYLIAGPGWKGETPPDITKIIPSDTEFVFTLYRTQLFDPGDIEKVKMIQAGYKVATLSKFLGMEAPPAAPEIDFPPYDAEKAHGIGFINYLNFLLQFCPTVDSEKGLMTQFARIGIGPGKTFDPSQYPPPKSSNP